MIDLFSYGKKLNEKDMLILCSDGITDYISDDIFENILNSDMPHSDMQEELIKQALEGGSKDNLSVVFISLYPAAE